jgi:hypothetical protein
MMSLAAISGRYIRGRYIKNIISSWVFASFKATAPDGDIPEDGMCPRQLESNLAVSSSHAPCVDRRGREETSVNLEKG